MMRAFVFILLAGLVFCSCNTHTSNSKKELQLTDSSNVNVFRKGEVNILYSPDFNNCNYALYVPDDSVQSYPLIMIFDPQASGNHAVSRYKDLADKYKIAIAASNNIHNKMPPEQFSFYAFRTIENIMETIPVDSGFVYLMGFSGGARVAAWLALNENVFKGVIGCGAGTPEISGIKLTDFIYIGLSGYSDFNFYEMYVSENEISKSNARAHFKYFEGGHEWPPDSAMEYAFAAITHDIYNNVNELTSTYINDEINRLNSIPVRDAWKKMSGYKSLKYLTELLPCVKEKKLINAYLSGYESRLAERNLNNILADETKLQALLSSDFYGKGLDWWNIRIEQLSASKFKKDKSPSNYKDIRLLNYVSMLGFVYSLKYLSENDMINAEKSLNIYRKSDSQNPDFKFLYSLYLIEQMKYSEALDSLESSVKSSFSNIIMWQSEKRLNILRDSLRFINMENILFSGNNSKK